MGAAAALGSTGRKFDSQSNLRKLNVSDVSEVSPRDIYMRLCACRDFEIKLQWERAVFLTAFLIACFAGYGSFLLSVGQHGCGESNFSPLVINGIFITLTFVGVVLSLLWILMAKGSKAWYEHYEQAIAAFAKMSGSQDNASGTQGNADGDQVNAGGSKEKSGTAQGATTNSVPEYMMAHRWYDMPDIERCAMSNSVFCLKGGAYSVSKIVIAIGICSLLIWGTLFLVHCGVAVSGPISRWCESSDWLKIVSVTALVIIALFLAWLALYSLTRILGSGYLEKVKVFLPKHVSDLKKEAWTPQCGPVKEWISHQPEDKRARRYVLVEEKRTVVYDRSTGYEEMPPNLPTDVKVFRMGNGLFSLRQDEEV
jgi:hypothetical protein